MLLNKMLFPVLAAAFFCACALPVKKTAAVMPAPEKKEAPAKLSSEDAQKVEVLYYKAVGAYSNNDMSGALNYLNEISTVSVFYQSAVELRAKIKSVSGSKQAPLFKP
jgi:hypothetical protein